MEHQSYIHQQKSFLRNYDLIIWIIRKPLAANSLAAPYGLEWLDSMFADARSEFVRLIPQIPYIGKKNVWKLNLIAVTMYLSVYRALNARGWTMDQAGQFLHQAHEAFANRFPAWMRHLVGAIALSPLSLREMKKGAEQSQLRRYPMDWVFDWVPGDGENLKYGLNIWECAVVKFYQQQGVEKLTRQLCNLDHFMAYAMGYQFRREGVLAVGSPCCDCRYIKGMGVNDWPPEYPQSKVH